MANVTITFDSETAEGKRIIAAMAGATVAAAPAPAGEATPAKATRTKKDAPAAPESPAPAATPASPAQEPVATSATGGEPEVTRQQLAEVIQAAVKNAAVGRAKVVAELEKFRPYVKAEHQKEPEIKLPMVPSDKYGALFTAIKALG